MRLLAYADRRTKSSTFRNAPNLRATTADVLSLARKTWLLLAIIVCSYEVAVGADVQIVNEGSSKDARRSSSLVVQSSETLVNSAVAMVGAGGITSAEPQPLNVRGWNHLFFQMAAQGADIEMLRKVFTDPRMPERRELLFSLNPIESAVLYRKHNTRKNRRNALAFYKTNSAEFKAAETRYQVPASVILAILQVETHCGKFTGKSPIFPGLARLAAAATPENVSVNIMQKKAAEDPELARKVRERALWLESTFLPHALAALRMARSGGEHPLELTGSSAGAIGLPQFLPGHVATYGVDGNGDGTVDLHQPKDAIPSVARFLHQHGWKKISLPRSEQEKVVWNYNRSKAYVATVLAMARDLRPQLK